MNIFLRTVKNYAWTIAYIMILPLTNWMFIHLPMYQLADNLEWSPASFIFGFIFVFRDFAQNEIGKGILLAMLIAAGLRTCLKFFNNQVH